MRSIIGLFVVMLFSALGASMAVAVPMNATEIPFFQAKSTLQTQPADVGFAARAPPVAVPNVAITGGVTAMHGGAFVTHGVETQWASLNFGADLYATNTTRLTVADFPQVRTTVSQKQNRHIAGRPEYRGGGILSSQADAQRVLDAYHNGDAVILGQTSQGFPVVRFNGVTGTNNNVGAGIMNQPTNVFIVKGTASPSIVPANPNWTP